MAVNKDNVKQEIVKLRIRYKDMTIKDLKQKIELLAKKAVASIGADLIECKVAGRINDLVHPNHSRQTSRWHYYRGMCYIEQSFSGRHHAGKFINSRDFFPGSFFARV